MFSNVWSENTALFERLMEIHSNSPKLYYGFKPLAVNIFSMCGIFPLLDADDIFNFYEMALLKKYFDPGMV